MIRRMRPANRAQAVIDPRVDRRSDEKDQREHGRDDGGARNRAACHERPRNDQHRERHEKEHRIAPVEPQIAAEHQRRDRWREYQHRADDEHEERIGIFNRDGIQRAAPWPQQRGADDDGDPD